MEEHSSKKIKTKEIKNEMKVVITGATGLLGRSLMKEFQDYDVVGIGWSRSGKNIKKVDLRDFKAVEEFLIDEFPGKSNSKKKKEKKENYKKGY